MSGFTGQTVPEIHEPAVALRTCDCKKDHGRARWTHLGRSELGKGTEVYFTLKKETEQKEEHDE